jgi:1-phosphatidylinositol-5-phosphate 4-kinase
VHSFFKYGLLHKSKLFKLLMEMLQINELSHVTIPVMLLPDDFRAYSKVKVDNHLFNKLVFN